MEQISSSIMTMSASKRPTILGVLVLNLLTVLCCTSTHAQSTPAPENIPYIPVKSWEKAVNDVQEFRKAGVDIIQIEFSSHVCLNAKDVTFKYMNLIYFYVSQKGEVILSYPAEADSILSLNILGSNKKRMAVEVTFSNCRFSDMELKQCLKALAVNLTSTQETVSDKYLCYYQGKMDPSLYFLRRIFLPYLPSNRFDTICLKQNVSTSETVLDRNSFSSDFVFIFGCLALYLFPLWTAVLPLTKVCNTNEYCEHDTPYSFSMLWRIIVQSGWANTANMESDPGSKNMQRRRQVGSGIKQKCYRFHPRNIAPTPRALILFLWISVAFLLIVSTVERSSGRLQFTIKSGFGSVSLLHVQAIFATLAICVPFAIIYFDILFRASRPFKIFFPRIYSAEKSWENPLKDLKWDIADSSVPIQFQFLRLISCSLFSANFWWQVLKKSVSFNDIKCPQSLLDCLKLIIRTMLLPLLLLVNIVLVVLQCNPVMNLACTLCAKGAKCRNAAYFPYVVLIIACVNFTYVYAMQIVIQGVIFTVCVGIPLYPQYAAAKAGLTIAFSRVLISYYNWWQKQLRAMLKTVFEETSDIRSSPTTIPKKAFMFVYYNNYYATIPGFLAKISFTASFVWIAYSAFEQSGRFTHEYGTTISAMILYFLPEALEAIFGSEEQTEKQISRSIKDFVKTNKDKMQEMLTSDTASSQLELEMGEGESQSQLHV